MTATQVAEILASRLALLTCRNERACKAQRRKPAQPKRRQSRPEKRA